MAVLLKIQVFFWNDILCLLVKRELFTQWYLFVSLFNKNIKFYSHQLMHFLMQPCISLLSYIKIT